MTDEERAEAERLADEHVTPLDRALAHKAFVAGYAAACESKCAEIDFHKCRPCEDVINLLEAERALSAKLYATLDSIRGYVIARGSQGTAGPIDDEVIYEACDEATTEYVAARV